MSEDVKPRKFSIKFNGLYVPPLVTALASGKLKYEDEMVYVIELEPTLQLMKEMGEVIRGHDCLKGSAYFDGEDRTITECTSCDVLEKYRKFLEGIER